MLLKKYIKRCESMQKYSNFFQNVQNHGFCNFEF